MAVRTFNAKRDDAGQARAIVRAIYADTPAGDALLHNPEVVIGLELRGYLRRLYQGRIAQGHAVGSLEGWARAIAYSSAKIDVEVSFASVSRHAAKIGVSLPDTFIERVAVEVAAAKAAGVLTLDPHVLGEMVQLTAAEREELRIRRLLEACDESRADRINRQRREKRGTRPRAQSSSVTKPWIADGYSCRRTWERHGKRPKVSQLWSSTIEDSIEEESSTKLATQAGCSTKLATLTGSSTISVPTPGCSTKVVPSGGGSANG